MALLGCLWIPDFEILTAMRANPALREQPFVLHRGGRIVAMSELAQRCGIARGAVVSQAKNLLPQLLSFPVDEAACDWAWQQILARLNEWTPRIESVREGLCFFEMPAPLASQRALSRFVFGQHGRCGVAANRATAELAAYVAPPRQMRGVRAGQEAAFVEGVGVEVLLEAGASLRTIERLNWFGLRWIGQLSVLSREELSQQFEDGELLWHFVQTAQDSDQAIECYVVPPSVQSRFDFPTSSSRPQRWEAVLDELLEEAASQLGGQSTLGLSLGVGIGGVRRVGSRLLTQPARHARTLREPARALLLSLLHDEATREATKPVAVQSMEVRLGNLKTEKSPLLDTQNCEPPSPSLFDRLETRCLNVAMDVAAQLHGDLTELHGCALL